MSSRNMGIFLALACGLTLGLAGCGDDGDGDQGDGGGGDRTDVNICASDTECPADEVCTSGTCVPRFVCRSDAECNQALGETCNLLTGACVGGPGDGGTPDGAVGDGGTGDGGPTACTPGDARCTAASDGVETCAADGSGYTAVACTAPNPYCLNAICMACQPGTGTCNGDLASTCRVDGTGYNDTDCSTTGGVCANGACQLCVPASKQCKDTSVLQTCDSTGTTWIETVCTDGVCDSTLNDCVTQSCTPGTLSCQGDLVMECDAGGTTLNQIEDCAAQASSCAAGACVDLCTQAVANNSYIGCEYWPVALSNVPLDSIFYTEFAVVVSNPNVGTVADIDVFDSLGSVVATASVQPGQLATIRLPWNAMDIVDGSFSPITRRGAIAYRLVSSVPVTAYQFNPLQSKIGITYSHTNDASLLLPTHIYGDSGASPVSQYLAMTVPHMDIDYQDEVYFGFGIWLSAGGGSGELPAFVAVVATQPGVTNVQMVSRGATASGGGLAQANPGDTISFSLNQYEVVQFATRISGAATSSSNTSYFDADTRRVTNYREYRQGDLTGSVITADQPIAVYGGADCRFVPFDAWACDHLEQQLFPFKNWGANYVGAHSNPTGSGFFGDLWRVLAAVDGTTVVFTPASACGSACSGGTATLNAGDKMQFTTTADFLVQSQDVAHPIMVAQFFVGQSATGAAVGDPTMILAIPTEQYRSDYAFTTPTTIVQDYINVVRPAGATVNLDGGVVSASWTAIGSTGWEVARISILDGVHKVAASSPIGLSVYGFDEFVSYGYPGGLDLKTVVTINPGG